MRFVALSDRDLARTQDRQGRGGWDGKPAMRAVYPAISLDDSAGQDARFAQKLKADTRAHDIYNRIHRPNFVEMHLVRRQAMDFSLGQGYSLKDGHGFFFHPR